MNVAETWMELENITLSEGNTETEKICMAYIYLYNGISHKVKDNHAIIHRSKEAK